MKIVLLCEGKTEAALQPALKRFLDEKCRAPGMRKVGLVVKPFHGHPNPGEVRKRLDENVRRVKSNLLGVIALLDVYPRFADAAEAKNYLRDCVKESPNKDIFYAHAAQYEVEAWLLPFWDDIAKRLGVQQSPPGRNPEKVNKLKPPSKHLRELYGRARKKQAYEKPIEAPKFLKDEIALAKAGEKCPELQSLLDTLTHLCEQTAA